MPPVKYLGFRQRVSDGKKGDEFEIRPTLDAVGLPVLELWRKSPDGTQTALREPGTLVSLLLAFCIGAVESNVSKATQEKAWDATKHIQTDNG